jgi:hypothetical protein
MESYKLGMGYILPAKIKARYCALTIRLGKT